MYRIRVMQVLVCAAMATVCAGRAEAQNWGRDEGFRQMAQDMGYGDYRAFESDRAKARMAQLTALDGGVGSRSAWSNRYTGSSGTSTVIDMGRDAHGVPCGLLREQVTANGRGQVSEGMACKDRGSWLTVR